MVPFSWYLSFHTEEVDEQTVSKMFEAQVAPGRKVITPHLLAYFDYLVWYSTQPAKSRIGAEDEAV
jgi:hypothetical protein